MDDFQLAILLTTAGAAVGAGLVKTIVSAVKGLGLIAEHGRAPMLAALVCSGVLIGLAVWDAGLFADGITAQDVFIALLSLFGLYAASIGTHETVIKAQRIWSGTTNPTGPDQG